MASLSPHGLAASADSSSSGSFLGLMGKGKLIVTLLLILLASELSHVRVQLEFQIRMCIYMWLYVKLYAHAQYFITRKQKVVWTWWYVMWEELSINHFLKHSNHLK